jgi:hypothetical protein
MFHKPITTYVGLILAYLILAGVAGSTASAHVKDSNGQWLFTGSTYGKDQPRSGTPAPAPEERYRSDPLSVVWRGPFDGTAKTVKRVETHTEDDWSDRYIPNRARNGRTYPRGKRMKTRTLRTCSTAQHIFMRSGGANRGQWSSSTGYMTTLYGCLGSQYHIRLWSSKVHGEQYGAAEHGNEWVLSPIHFDLAVSAWCVPVVTPGGVRKVCKPKHITGMPFDQARSAYIHAIKRKHCYDREWAYHPESTGYRYGSPSFTYSGIVSRISFKHRDSAGGCEGA